MRKLRHEEIPRLSPAVASLHPRHPVTVIVHDVRSIYNVGSLFRTADAAFIERLVLTGISGTPRNPALHKTALGAQDTVPWRYESDPVDVLNGLKQQGYTLAALEITDTPTFTDALPASAFPLGLVLGNEVHGVPDELLAKVDIALEIPQFGTKQSLNVAVAFGIAAFDLVRTYRRSMPQSLHSQP